ncbi:MAG TPA: septation protein A [Bauldia sp.]|nr:septation protein A [Bauldia sp.]
MTFESAPNEPHTPEEKKLNPWLKLALEVGPLLIFFVANARGEKMAASWPIITQLGGPIFFATAVFIVATLLALAISYALTRRLPLMPFVTAIVVVVFGGLTLWLHDERFIKIKPTIIYCLFGGILLGGLLFGRALMGYVFDAVFKLDDDGWRKLTFRWGLFFFGLAILNEIVWRSVSTDTWVTFKVFAIVPITFVFALTQMPLIQKHSLEEKPQE